MKINIAIIVLLGLLTARAPVRAACSVTFTPNATGTHPRSLRYEPESKTLTIQTSRLPKHATIFRAELVLRPERRFADPVLKPTCVFPVGTPSKKLKWIAPRCVSLDALDVVRRAVKAGEDLKLTPETTLNGVARLEVSYLEGKLANAPPGVTELQARHRKGQTLLTFREPKLIEYPELKTGADVAAFKKRLLDKHKGLRFRIWRALVKITPRTIAQAKLVGECGLLTAWNDRYYQDDTAKRPPVRYRVVDNGKPLAWGAAVYAHNPTEKGKAHYAVTVAVNGEEDLDQLTAANTTADAVDEIVGLGEPVLQWIERPDPKVGWLYRRGDLARLIYVRWESGPHSATPSNPIDYLVVLPLSPMPKGEIREPQGKAFQARGNAPVGLHLHCWGGSCNGGYGWWYNAHRGAVLIASNQVPYDWWTGHHERRGTRKTWGDGVVRPFTIERTFGFLDWATKQWREAPKEVRDLWPPLDRTRVFTAGNSMGGSGAPMIALRHADKVAWGLGWVGVHVPELSPTFKGSYQNGYGPRSAAITMPDGKTSPWDHYSDVWWMRKNVAASTGLIIASNGKNDGGIGWKQAVLFARALQETRRPHFFNWGMGGHGTRTLVGSNFDLDLGTDQSLPAFTNCSLDDDVGNGDPKSGAATGQYNAHLWWQTDDVIDEATRWEMTVLLKSNAPKDNCTVDVTPRRCQAFRPKPGQKLGWSNKSLRTRKTLQSGTVIVDEWGLVTLPNMIIEKGKNRLAIRE